ncbi:hypothetical protein SAMN05661080_03414 [Modestobacter sp. DSM 44400]|uniref:hypothetical protein n=1 Tax=Modestobacter sp. DSM 44400 TaxID=1550230 RepID=UPI00089D32AC|nr:hypothetical protein [Modestobacter sp. DSM 44400]SDY41507.1 hypothetical protein SAMN05661080_03414 [Modestobacter sp. DSM 44400]
MLIDCDTCTVRGPGCDDCVVTVLLGAPPGWRNSEPTVVPLIRRPRVADHPLAVTPSVAVAGDLPHVHGEGEELRPVVELDDVERRAVRALADFGLVPPLRHQDASTGTPGRDTAGNRHVS